MQFTGHSLPVHQSMSVPWEFFTSSHFISQFPPTWFPLITAIRMCHFLPAHHLGMAFLAGSKAKIQQSIPWIAPLYSWSLPYLSAKQGSIKYHFLEYIKDLVLNNPQRLICHKTQPNSTWNWFWYYFSNVSLITLFNMNFIAKWCENIFRGCWFQIWHWFCEIEFVYFLFF